MKCLTCAVVTLALVLSFVVKAETPVSFADSNLKAAVEQTLGISNPTPTDMLALTSLSASLKGINDLTGLEYAHNLLSLYMFYNNINDISPLTGLTRLERLILGLNNIGDISPLLSLKALKELSIGFNPVTDISPLSGLESLEILNLAGCEIADLSPLVSLENLVQLELNSNKIIDISGLAGLRNLQWLNLNDNKVNDISALSGLTNLTTLWLSNNHIFNIQTLSNMMNLQSLDLRNNPLNQDAYSIYIPLIRQNNPGITMYYDPPPPPPVSFADPNLKAAVEQTLGISEPTPTDMLNITSLFARDLNIVSIMGLEYATNLTRLYLENNQISNISALSELTNLNDLFLHNNKITDISPLSGLTKLNRLGLSDNPVGSILALDGLANLKELYADSCGIRDISPLSGLINVEDLYLSYNQISDISALSGLTNLTTLALGGNHLNQDAYDIYIPLICRNNPGVALYYDLPGPVQVPKANTEPAYAGWTTAGLRGYVDDDGGQVCEYRFRYKKNGEPYNYSSWNRSVTDGQYFSQTITSLIPQTTYRFSAQLRNSAGESEWANEQFLTTLASPPVLTGDYQAVEGFSSVTGSSNHGNYNTYRGQATRSYWEYAGSANQSIEWTTARVPSGYTAGRITFVWSGANGIGKGNHDLYHNGMKILTFNSGQSADCSWVNGNYELFFDFKNHNADNAGVYYFTVPVSVITPNDASIIKVESGSSEAGFAWGMVHDFVNTLEYEMVGGELKNTHIGRASEVVVGDCSDGIQNGDETGIDCGGSCITSDPEICNGIDDNRNGLIDEDVKFLYGHYYVNAALCLEQNARDYVKDVNDIGYPVLVDVLGFAPEIDTYIVDFTLENFPGGFYTGLSTVDGITGGNIALWDEPVRNPSAYPRNMCYDLLYETIHGFTHPLKYDLQTGAARHAVIGRGEDFDIIFEVEALSRLCVTDCVNELYAVFYSNAAFPHFPVYYDIRDKYGWEPIKQFLNILNQIKDEVHVDTDDQECYYISISVGEDVSAIYEKHNKTISQETKDRIKSDIGL